MGRSESKQAYADSSAMAKGDQANAQTALANQGKALGDYNTNLGNFLNFGRQTYGPNGEFMRNTNAQATTQAAAGSKAISGDLALRAMRTGENTAGYAPAVAEERRQASRDMTAGLVSADADRLSRLTAINQYGVDASKFPAETYGSIYGTSVGGANNAMGNATQAAKTPGFWDVFGPALVGAAGTAGAGFAPHGPCWVAAEIFGGWYEPRTVLVREWLNGEFSRSIVGKAVVALYLRYGQAIARQVRKRRWLKAALRPLFDMALRQAVKHALR